MAALHVEHPPPEMQRAARQGDPNCISKPQPNQNATTGQADQSETALAAHASASHYPDGRISEIFINVGKAGSELQLHAETCAILAWQRRLNWRCGRDVKPGS
jgi:hypothetical protein